MKRIATGLTLLPLLFFITFAQARDAKHTLPPEINFHQGVPLVSVSGVLRDITQARSDIHKSDLADAKEVLQRARLGIEFIMKSSPAAQVRNYIWVAKQHLSYENRDTILRDFIAIHSSLKSLGKMRYVENARRYINKAMHALKNEDRDSAELELEFADKALVDGQLNLPLSIVEGYVVSAQEDLTSNEPEKADQALKRAENEFQFIVVDVYSSLPRTGGSTGASEKTSAKREYVVAKKELDHAGEYLRKTLRSGDAEIRKEAEKLSGVLAVLRGKGEKIGNAGKREVESLWERTKALAERDAEYTDLIARKVGTISRTKRNLMDAKLHLLYAETYHMTTGDKQKAGSELRKAERDIRDAMKQADEATRTQLVNLDKKLKELQSALNRKDTYIKRLYSTVEEELAQLIYKQ